MTDALSHRGPDDRGIYINGPLGLGFRRLSIIDVSYAGHQPMSNEDGSIWIVFNGEIYDFGALRNLLIAKGHQFKSATDTEVIVHAYEEYGLQCLEHLDGMFAFALWDTKKRQLFIARDRFGIKPLHYYSDNRVFAFSSEIKSLCRLPEIPLSIDEESLWQYFSYMQIPAPRTIYAGIKKLLPAHAMLVDETGKSHIWKYWNLEIFNDFSRSEAQQTEELRYLFEESIKRHLVADVPVGVYLSGGFDSSCVTAYAAKLSQEPVKTFSVSFRGNGKFDESPYQHLVSSAYGTHHHEFVAKPDILSTIKLLVEECDEPFGISSAVPLYLVSKLASEHVKVVLSGDGSDELFAGYEWRIGFSASLNKLDILPASVWQQIQRALEWNERSAGYGNSIIEKLRKYAAWGALSHDQRYLSLQSVFSPKEKFRLFQKEFIERVINENPFTRLGDELPADGFNRYLAFDFMTSLADEMLTKVDRCTAMVGIEGRVPFLDRAFVEAGCKIPLERKLAHGQGKQILRKALGAALPKEVLKREKAGFSVPLLKWVNENDVKELGQADKYIRQEMVLKMIQEHRTGVKNHAVAFWLIKVFDVWMQHFETLKNQR